jgi:DNA invertase Pin-like site-specific DNA recombinase
MKKSIYYEPKNLTPKEVRLTIALSMKHMSTPVRDVREWNIKRAQYLNRLNSNKNVRELAANAIDTSGIISKVLINKPKNHAIKDA